MSLHERRSKSNSSTDPRTTPRSEMPQQELPPPRGILGRSNRMIDRFRENGEGTTPFAGRLGGVGAFTLDRSDPDDQSLLERVPDAAPNLNFHQAFDMRGFAEPILWKAGFIEMFGTSLSSFASLWFAVSPNIPPPIPNNITGPFGTASFIGAAAGSIQAGLLISLLVYGFGSVSGAHFNPLITIGTFFARLTTFPRLVIYVFFQIAGASIAGLMLRAGQNSTDFKVGGCFKFPPATTGGALAVEIMACLLALFLAFGVGLDPRQRSVFSPALAPALVGAVVMLLTLSFSFPLQGYGGASLNPARCLGAYVGQNRFPDWHWIHWVGVVGASAFHGLLYYMVPPETFAGSRAAEDRKLPYLRDGLGQQHLHRGPGLAKREV